MYAKVHQKYGKLFKNQPLSRLFRLINGQSRCFNLLTCEVSGCASKNREWNLSVFVHFYEGLIEVLNRFFLGPFVTFFFAFFFAFLTLSRPLFDHTDANVGSFWG